MKILKKMGVLVCTVGILAESPVMNVWAAPETVVMSRILSESPETVNQMAVETAELKIDSENCYTGMDQPYSKGYTPKVENGTASLVVPVVCQGQLRDDTLKVSLNLGSGNGIPFISEKYEKDIGLSQEKINGSQETIACYLVNFDLKLKDDRKNGEYPVVLNVQTEDIDGNLIHKEFSVNVVITDEKPPASEPSTEEPSTDEPSTVEPSTEEPSTDEPSTGEPSTEPSTEAPKDDLTGAVDVTGPSGSDSGGGASSGGSGGGSSASEAPTFAPKIIVQSCKSSKDEIQAGDEVTLDITLLNTSSTETVRNMTVSIGDEGEYLNLLSPTDTIYVDSVSAGQTCVVSYKYKILASAVPGAYGLSVSMDYADSKGASQSASGKIKMMVSQAVKLEFDPLVLASEVQVGDVVTAQIQAMNLGRSKVHNVRAVIEADGLAPEGTLFIGDIEAGKTATGTVKISVTSLSKGSSLYGETRGTVTYYYEDENGKEYEETGNITTNIKTPFSNTTKETPEDTGQWWIIMAVVVGILFFFIIGMILRGIRRKKRQDEAEETAE
ncbi:hypothetical protein [Frisingicoccus sp.]|uniref:COG1361 S-layer family protein n=1 Tax=Frisingicoccus sp. TaxID=1918627 RepID=UPI003995DAD2